MFQALGKEQNHAVSHAPKRASRQPFARALAQLFCLVAAVGFVILPSASMARVPDIRSSSKASATEDVMNQVNEIGPVLPDTVTQPWALLLKKPLERMTQLQLAAIRKLQLPNLPIIQANLSDPFANNPNTTIIKSAESYLYIIDTPEVNAFVSPKTVGPKLYNFVFITSGLVREVLEEPLRERNEAKVRRGLEDLSGILGHEMRHPVDYLDPNSVEGEWGSIRASQAIELITDTDAINYLRGSQLPTNSLLRALRTIVAVKDSELDKKPAPVGIQSHSSTHPEMLVRLTMQRMALVLMREALGEGDIDPNVFQFQIDQLSEQLTTFKNAKPSSRPAKFQEFTSVDQIFVELNKLADDSASAPSSSKAPLEAEERQQRFNHLFFSLLELTKDWKTKASQAEQTRFASALGSLISGSGELAGVSSYLYNLSDSASFGAKTYFPKGFHKFHPQSLTELINSHSLCSVLDFAQQLRKDIVPAFEKYISKKNEQGRSEIFRLSRVLFAVLPDESVQATFQTEFQAAFRQYWGFEAAFISLLDLRNQMRASADFLETKYQRMPVALRAAAFTEARDRVPGRAYAFPFGMSYSAYSDMRTDRFGLLALRRMDIEQEGKIRRLMLNTVFAEKGLQSTPAYKADRRKVAERIWWDRGLIATLSLAPDWSAINVDWNFVFKELGIAPVDGYRQIAEAVKAFTQTEGFYQIFKDPNILQEKGGFNIPILWGELDLMPYLRGDHNPWIMKERGRGDESQNQHWVLAQELMVRNYRLVPQALMVEMARFLVEHRDGDPVPPLDELNERLIQQIVKRISSDPQQMKELASGHKKELSKLVNLWARAIDRAPVDAKKKRRFLELLLTSRTLFADAKRSASTVRILQKYGVVNSAGELVSKSVAFTSDETPVNGLVRTTIHKKFSDSTSKESYSSVQRHLVREFQELAKRSTNEAERTARLVAHIESVFGLTSRHDRSSVAIRNIQGAAFEALASVNVDFEARVRMFKVIQAAHGGSEAGDQYFRQYIEADLIKRVRNTGHGFELVSPSYLRSVSYRAKVFEKLLPLLKDGSGRGAPLTIESAVTMLEKAIPEPSLDRDALVERMAWSFGIDDLERLEKLEKLKSMQSWRTLKPEVVNLASLLSENLVHFDRREMIELVRYFLNDDPGELPEPIRKKIASVVRADREKVGLVWNLIEHGSTVDEAISVLIEKIESGARETRGLLRVPIFDLLFYAGRHPMIQDPHFFAFAVEEFLGLKPTDKRTNPLISLIDAAHEDERTIVLSYMLARKSEAKGGDLDLKDIFEIFHTVGKKAGQAADTFKLASSLRDLKDKARPLSKYQIVKAFKAELPAREFKRIKRIVRVIAAASVKTVVEVELVTGERIAMAVLGENASPQIKSDAGYASRFMNLMIDRKVVDESKMMSRLTDQLGNQLFDELDMRNEAKKIKRASSTLKKVVASLGPELAGWTIEVTDSVSEISATPRVLPMKLAEGVPLDEITDPQLKEEIGTVLNKVFLRAFFGFAWFDADRHLGNQLIKVDPKTKRITILDFGQSRVYRKRPWFMKDDRTLIADLVFAIGTGDAKAVYRAMVAMSEKFTASAAIETKIQTKIDELLRRKEKSELLLSLVKIFVEEGVAPQPRFFTGVFKGLIILTGEGYTSPEVFAQLLEREVKNHYRQKYPWVGDKKIGEAERKTLAAQRGVSCQGIFVRP